MQMYTDAQGTLWLLTETALARFDPTVDHFDVYAVPREQAMTSFFRTALTDVNGHFLIGGGDGLYWFEPTTGGFTRIADTAEHVEVLHRDASGVIWVGRRSGLYQFNPITQRTRLIYRHDAANGSSLTDSNITSLLSGQNGLLWIGTRQGGLNRLDPQQQQFTRYAFGTEMRPAMPGAAVQAVVEGRADELWVIDSHNLYRLRQQEQITATAVMPAGPSPFPNEPFAVAVYPLPAIDARSETGGSPIGHLLLDHRGHLWLSLLGTDVFEFNPETETFTAYALSSGPPQPGPPANVNAMIEDEMHNLWFAVSFTGLYRLDATRQELTAIRYRGRPDFFTDTPDNIASAAVVALTSDGQGALWIGYHDGTLSRFVPAENRFTHYPSRSRLPGWRQTATRKNKYAPMGEAVPSAFPVGSDVNHSC